MGPVKSCALALQYGFITFPRRLFVPGSTGAASLYYGASKLPKFFFKMYCMVPSNKPQTTILGALCSTNMGALYHIVWYAMYETANEPQFRARSFLIALYCMVRWVRSLLSALYRMVRYETANGGRAKRICARKPRGSTYPESC